MKSSFQSCFRFYFTFSSPSLAARYEPPLPLSPLLLPSSYLAQLDSPSQLLCPLPLCVLEGGALRG